MNEEKITYVENFHINPTSQDMVANFKLQSGREKF